MVPVKQLLEAHWQLAVENVIPVGPVWRVETVQGDFCFKRGKHSLSRLFFDYHAIEYLWKQGFTGTPRVIPTTYGNPIIQSDDGLFFLTKWIGRPLDSTSKAEWLQAARTLGNFHHASQGMSFPAATKQVSFSGKWARRLADRTRELQDWFDSSQAPRNEFEELIHQDKKQILTLASHATGALQASAYERLVRDVELTPTLVHGNVKGENFSVETNGSVSLIDFDGFRLDVPVQDLANLFQDVLPALNWNLDDATDIFLSYHSARPVDEAEIPVLFALLAYPHSVYKEFRKYTTEPDRPLQKCLRKWPPALGEMYQTHEFLQKWAKIIKKCVQ